MKINYIIILALSFVLFGCYSKQGSYSNSGFSSSFSENQSFSNFLIIDKSSEKINLDGNIYLEKGTCELIIEDPVGKTIKMTFDKTGSYDLNRFFEPIPGKWILSFTSKNSEGDYKFNWNNRNKVNSDHSVGIDTDHSGGIDTDHSGGIDTDHSGGIDTDHSGGIDTDHSGGIDTDHGGGIDTDHSGV
ncbi:MULTISPECIES: hypothetical protein [unclassified Oceanispirochaeta]|uniref:hypothetical protein n=1 Tax=unclassified Oceanispirochaeta TaxID=2635722 RepID=UPI000E093874|nr:MULTISPECIES: hypothetical protein [unclassified Oceanispirochaeta]MBF9018735.1 hypothetical protein [Oceanispirochaeta sp. M2]NPD75173.1 hypothetical protein [Oceanispirochaeta sp. M1]RDG28956.1 hypothetical protein DV872_24055 [Oceanispirochaeta sp. M1]